MSTIDCIGLLTTVPLLHQSLQWTCGLTQSLPKLHNFCFDFNLLSIRYGFEIYTVQRTRNPKRLPESLLGYQGQGNRCGPVKKCRRGASMQGTSTIA